MNGRANLLNFINSRQANHQGINTNTQNKPPKQKSTLKTIPETSKKKKKKNPNKKNKQKKNKKKEWNQTTATPTKWNENQE